jgi:hypothetical protein
MNLGVARLWILIEERLRRQNHAAQAETALRGLLVDERLLKRVWALDRAQPFERRDLGASYRAHGRHARPHGASLDDHRARAALPQPTSELRAA